MARQPRPEDTVGRMQARPSHGSLIDGQLMPQSDDLEPQRQSGSEQRTECTQQRKNDSCIR